MVLKFVSASLLMVDGFVVHSSCFLLRHFEERMMQACLLLNAQYWDTGARRIVAALTLSNLSTS